MSDEGVTQPDGGKEPAKAEAVAPSDPAAVDGGGTEDVPAPDGAPPTPADGSQADTPPDAPGPAEADQPEAVPSSPIRTGVGADSGSPQDREAGGTTPPPDAEAPPLTLWRFGRAAAIALALLPITAYWAADQAMDIFLSLMVPPVSALMILVVLNIPLRQRSPRLAFTSAELVVVYAMLATGTAMAAEWMLSINPMIYGFALFGNQGNHFDDLMLPNLPALLFLKDPEPLRFFLGGGHGWGTVFASLGIWAKPVLAWTALVACLSLAMLCINSLMRIQWTQREKLSFPVIQLPITLVETAGPKRQPLWRDPILWFAFCAMGAIDLVNGLHHLSPSVPLLNVRFLGDLTQILAKSPWNATGWTPIGLFPFIVALGTFLPTDLTFSMIFFFFVRKAQQIIAFTLGYPQGTFGGGALVPAPPYFSEQTWGAFIALFVMALWSARDYLKTLGRRLRLGEPAPGDVPPRLALVGLAAGTLGTVWFGTLAGLPFGFGLLYVGIFLIFSAALTRMRAELGPPTHEMAFMGPNQLVVDIAGTQGLATPTVVGMMTTFFFFNRLHRSHPMPGELEAMKLGERARMSQRWIFAALFLAVIAGNLAGHAVRIYLGYRWGARSYGEGSSSIVNELVNSPRQPNPTAMAFVAIGFFTVYALNTMRFRFPWLPLNPVGYALSMNFGVDYYWFGLLIALILKLGTLRYAGLRGYRRLHAAMIGVILAEFAVETFWSAVAMIWRIPTYSISINGRLRWDQ